MENRFSFEWCLAVPCLPLALLVMGRTPAAQTAVPAGLESTLELPDTGKSTFVFEGFVVAPAGTSAEGVVVVSSAGGHATTDARGNFGLEVQAPPGVESVQITAVGRAGENLLSCRQVALSVPSGSVWVGALTLVRGDTCTPRWLPTFGGQPGTDQAVLALAAFDDGQGAALYAGGHFTTAGGVEAQRIARWDGSSWVALGGGMNGAVRALTVYDDGSGAALFAGGDFTVAGGVPANRMAKWNGTSWAALGNGTGIGNGVNGSIHALTVVDLGGEVELYAGGDFWIAGGVPANRIAKWNGTRWAKLGPGVDSTVHALTTFDDGGGAALYAGGFFTTAGGEAARRIARWDGTSWAPLGNGVNGSVVALTTFDGGGRPALYAGGTFTAATGAAANRVAKWDGTSWTVLGTGAGGTVTSMAVFDDGDGAALYIAGAFATAGDIEASSIARWDGTSWEGLGGGVSGGISALAACECDGQTVLYAGGSLQAAGDRPLKNIAEWNGARWSALGKGRTAGVSALAVFDDGDGAALYAGGPLASVNGEPATHVSRWNGSDWSPLDGDTNAPVSTMTVFDDGSGPALYAGGPFTQAGGISARYIARWDGSSWSGLGSGMGGYFPYVDALTVFDDGGGAALHAGGSFVFAGGIEVNYVAKWDGARWSALGSGMDHPVEALTVFDDGSGPALYAGGRFTTAGGVAASRIARWDGATWTALGSGMGGPPFPPVEALASFDDGNGPALYAGGYFTTAGGVAANRIARWDGSSWSALGSGMSHLSSTTVVLELKALDDGRGPALFAAGVFTSAGGLAAGFLARWDGASWSALGKGLSSSVSALAVFDDGRGPALYAGGGFTSAFESHDSYLARWACADRTPPVVACPASLLVTDRPQDGPGEFVTFSVSATDALDPAPTLACTPPSGSRFPPGNTRVTCTATDASGNRSTCQFAITVR